MPIAMIMMRMVKYVVMMVIMILKGIMVNAIVIIIPRIKISIMTKY